MDEIRKLLDENAVLPLWPQTGRVLGLRRGATYAAAQSGEIRTVRFGRLMRVPTTWLKAKLGIEPEAA
jgi:excisionase family DNA binding protein